jgi:hypothetical protein
MPLFLMDEDRTYQPARTDSGASLVILASELHPNDIGARIGLAADRWWLRGESESHPSNGVTRRIPHKNSGWVIESRPERTASAEEHLMDLLDRIGDRTEAIAALRSDDGVLSVALWIGHHTDNGNPGFSFKHDVLQRIAALGSSLEIDVYVDMGDLEVAPEIPLPPRLKLPFANKRAR